jgi:CRP/FNR family transcriptional regulator, nitrogen fixation regulation protein
VERHRRLSGTDVLALPMTRRDIADYLGLALETVSRELSQLRALGILKFSETSQRQIMLESRQQLHSLNL